MRYTLLIFILYLIPGCLSTSNNKSNHTIKVRYADTIRLNELPAIGDFLSDSIRSTSNNRGQLINSATISPSTTVCYKGFVFDIAWNEYGKVNYIVTIDSNFITNENIRINMSLKEIKEIQKVDIYRMPGWGYYIKLQSGWFAAFCVDNTCTGRELDDTDLVIWIYKR